MSNPVSIQRCQFVDYPNKTVSFGFRASDNYEQVHNNFFDEADMKMNDLEFLNKVMINNELDSMFDSIQENQTGISIDGTWYDWNEIEHLFE